MAMATVAHAAAALRLPASVHIEKKPRSFAGQAARVSWPRRCRILCPKAVEFEVDQGPDVMAIAISGIALLIAAVGAGGFFSSRREGEEDRPSTEPCFPCSGTGAQTCRICTGNGSIAVELGDGEKEVSGCVICEGNGYVTCTNCRGTGIQPRYLDRRVFKEDDD